MVMCTTQTYMSEVLPPTLRGPILAFFPIFTLLGQLIGSIVVYVSMGKPGPNGYKHCFISEWAFSALPLTISLLMPESPAYLIRKNNLEAARQSKQRLVSSPEDADTLLEQTRLSIELEGETNGAAASAPGYIDCFRGTNCRRTAIVLFASLLPQLFGLTLLAKGSYFMQVVGMSARSSLVFLQVGVGLGLVANVGSMFTITKFGRRPLVIFGLTVCVFLWTGMGVVGCFAGTVMIWYVRFPME